MGLVFFGLTMIAYQAILLSDDQYRILANRRIGHSTPVTAN